MFERKKRERGSLKPLLRYYMLKLVRNDGTPEELKAKCRELFGIG